VDPKKLLLLAQGADPILVKLGGPLARALSRLGGPALVAPRTDDVQVVLVDVDRGILLRALA
jgi:hypothetical protein